MIQREFLNNQHYINLEDRISFFFFQITVETECTFKPFFFFAFQNTTTEYVDPYPFEDFAPTLSQCFVIVIIG